MDGDALTETAVVNPNIATKDQLGQALTCHERQLYERRQRGFGRGHFHGGLARGNFKERLHRAAFRRAGLHGECFAFHGE